MRSAGFSGTSRYPSSAKGNHWCGSMSWQKRTATRSLPRERVMGRSSYRIAMTRSPCSALVAPRVTSPKLCFYAERTSKPLRVCGSIRTLKTFCLKEPSAEPFALTAGPDRLSQVQVSSLVGLCVNVSLVSICCRAENPEERTPEKLKAQERCPASTDSRTPRTVYQVDRLVVQFGGRRI